MEKIFGGVQNHSGGGLINILGGCAPPPHPPENPTLFCMLYTAKNAQVVTSLLASCSNLLQQADIRMRSHGL